MSDRLLELTGTIAPGGNKQILDKLDVERERGITVKAQTCSMIYNYKVCVDHLHYRTIAYGGVGRGLSPPSCRYSRTC